jgi:hypothetical protein
MHFLVCFSFFTFPSLLAALCDREETTHYLQDLRQDLRMTLPDNLAVPPSAFVATLASPAAATACADALVALVPLLAYPSAEAKASSKDAVARLGDMLVGVQAASGQPLLQHRSPPATAAAGASCHRQYMPRHAASPLPGCAARFGLFLYPIAAGDSPAQPPPAPRGGAAVARAAGRSAATPAKRERTG